jgi:RIO kinase 1
MQRAAAAAAATAAAAGGSGKAALQPNQNSMQKLSSRILGSVRDDPLDGLAGMRLSAGVANELRVSSAKAAASRIRAGDKSDRATVEQALDPRTRMVRVLGCVSCVC